MKREINRIRDDIKVFRDEDVEMNLLVELKQKEDDLDHIIRTVVPKHQIPDDPDPEERRKMGLPDEYVDDWVDIPHDYVRDMGGSPRKIDLSELPPEERKGNRKAQERL